MREAAGGLASSSAPGAVVGLEVPGEPRGTPGNPGGWDQFWARWMGLEGTSHLEMDDWG